MERLGSTVLLDPAPSNKDETTTGNLHVINGIDVATALVPEEEERQFEVTRTCARETENRNQLRLWTARIPVFSKPSTSSKQERVRRSTQKKCGKEKPNKCKSSMSLKSKRKLSSRRFERHQERKYGQNGWKHEKDPNKPWYESSGLSPRGSSTQSKSRTKCTKRCGWSSGYFEPHPRQRSLQRVHLANASFADLKVQRNRDTISFYVVTPKDLRRKRKIWSLLKNRCGTRDMGQISICDVCGGKSQRTLSSERRTGAVVVLESNVEDVQCSLVGWLHSRHCRCQSKRP